MKGVASAVSATNYAGITWRIMAFYGWANSVDVTWYNWRKRENEMTLMTWDDHYGNEHENERLNFC